MLLLQVTSQMTLMTYGSGGRGGFLSNPRFPALSRRFPAFSGFSPGLSRYISGIFSASFRQERGSPDLDSRARDQTKTMPPPSRRRYVFVWTCCFCAHSGIPVVVDPCPNCHYSRCNRCRVERILTRTSHVACCQNARCDDGTARFAAYGTTPRAPTFSPPPLSPALLLFLMASSPRQNNLNLALIGSLQPNHEEPRHIDFASDSLTRFLPTKPPIPTIPFAQPLRRCSGKATVW
ncbi:hypothetical protein RB213_012019 [Colletotrichum asianum]